MRWQSLADRLAHDEGRAAAHAAKREASKANQRQLLEAGANGPNDSYGLSEQGRPPSPMNNQSASQQAPDHEPYDRHASNKRVPEDLLIFRPIEKLLINVCHR